MSAEDFEGLSLSNSGSDSESIRTPSTSSSGSRRHGFDLSESAVPEAGFSYIICSVSSGRVLTLLNGDLVLKSLKTYGGHFWKREKYHGWLRFRNTVSGSLLDHNMIGGCDCRDSTTCSRVHIRLSKRGGYTLHMEENDRLEPVGLKHGSSKSKLTRLYHENVADALVWTFMEVGQVSARVREGVVRISTKVSTN